MKKVLVCLLFLVAAPVALELFRRRIDVAGEDVHAASLQHPGSAGKPRPGITSRPVRSSGIAWLDGELSMATVIACESEPCQRYRKLCRRGFRKRLHSSLCDGRSL